MPTIVKMPKWGLTMTAGTVVDWLAAEGSAVSEGDPLLTVETEKAVDDVPAPTDGILYRIVASAGSEVPVSGPVAVILAEGESLTDDDLAMLVRPADAPQVATATTASKPAREGRTASRDERGRVNASPAARKRAAELGVELQSVTATGPGGRITSDDVERAAAATGDGQIEERDIPVSGVGMLHTLTAGPRRARPIVFIHGLGGSLSTWQLVLGGLADGYRLIAVDLPGHGQSGKAPEADYSIEGHAKAVTEALLALSLSDAILVGHSLGGAVAMAIARKHEGLARGLVLIDSAGLGTAIAAELLTLMSGAPGSDTARNLLTLFVEDSRLVTPRAVEEMAAHQLAEGGWHAQQATSASAFADGRQIAVEAANLAEITQPVLIVWGQRDRVIPVDHAYGAVTALPDAQLAILPTAGHVPQIEAPDRTMTLIRRFAHSLS